MSIAEKESLLSVAKNHVLSKQEAFDTTDLRKKIIAQERENYLKGIGDSYSWEEVKAMALDKSKRYGQ